MRGHPAGSGRYPLVVESERLRLREHTVADREAMQAWTTDAEVVRYLPFGPLSGDDLDSYLEQLMAAAEEPERMSFDFVVEVVDTGAAVGAVSLGIESVLHRRAELGFVIRRADWGRGYASEAAGAVVDFGFDHLGLHRIWAVCVVGNQGSVRVLERVGMVREGTLRDHLLVAGEYHDTHLYGRVATAAYL